MFAFVFAAAAPSECAASFCKTNIFISLYIECRTNLPSVCVVCVAFESVIDQIQPELLNRHNQSISSCAHTDFMFCFS